ncbi:MAG: DUF4230 domain-containing protein [Prevotella sp.]|nr:DUF4230 domain-containing protein [Prevotella sp.]
MLERISKTWFLILAGVVVMVVVVVMLLTRFAQSSSLQMTQQGAMGITPVQIERIKNIGQWEFLSVSDEELVDTVRHGFFGDDELSRIYYGTLRLGIDLQEVDDGWITMTKDTVDVVLPAIKLLDKQFVDEARTKAFYEEGRWSEADKARLTVRAAKAMEARCLTPSNIRSAEQNATTQFSAMLRAMGYEYSRIRFKQ